MGMFAFRLQREEQERRAAAEAAKASVEVHELPEESKPVEVVAEIGGEPEEAPKPRRRRRTKAQIEADKLALEQGE